MNTTSEASPVLCRYRYDAQDFLAGVDLEAQVPVRLFYQQNRLSVEIKGALRRRVFQYESSLLAEQEVDDVSVRAGLLGTDVQRSVLHTLSSQGRQALVYSPYGHRSQQGTFLGFNGERQDPVTGHYALGNGYRSFNPVLMRFNQPDTLSPFGRGGLNAYGYCLGDPVNRSDPSGHITGVAAFAAARALRGVFQIERLPGEIIEQVVQKLPGKDLGSLSQTSSTMNWRALGLSKKSVIDIDDVNALQKIKDDLQGKALGVLPASLKSDAGYIAKFERAALRVDVEIQSLESEMQAIITRVTGNENAGHILFLDRVLRNQLAYAEQPEVLADINAVKQHYDELRSIHQRLVPRMQALAKQIRFNLYPR